MSQRYYDTAILSATFLGLGAALSLENAVVIEKGGLFGAEFINSYKGCEPKVAEAKTKLGKKFMDELTVRGLLDEKGEIYPAPTVYVLSKFLKEKSEGISVSKSLHAIIYNPDGRYIEGLSFNSLNGLYTYALPVDLNAKRYDAVETLCGKEHTFAENNMQISGIASDFAFYFAPDWAKRKKDDGENFAWFPSTACTNLAEAFDMGVWLGETFGMGASRKIEM